jgi:protein required for attachment to host cells
MSTGQGGTWVLVADAQHGRIFEVDDAGLVPRLRETVHASAEIGSRRSPEHGWTHGDDRHGEEAERKFAHELVHLLERGHSDNHYRHLVLVAPSRMLGVLRASLSRPLADMVRFSVHKDYGKMSDRELIEHVRPMVQIWPAR